MTMAARPAVIPHAEAPASAAVVADTAVVEAEDRTAVVVAEGRTAAAAVIIN